MRMPLDAFDDEDFLGLVSAWAELQVPFKALSFNSMHLLCEPDCVLNIFRDDVLSQFPSKDLSQSKK